MRVEGMEGKASICMTDESIAAFQEYLVKMGRSEETSKSYGRNLRYLQKWLSEDKRISYGTLNAFRQDMMDEGSTPANVNVRISAANSYVSWCGHRELQALNSLKIEKRAAPELTRREYIRMLQAARSEGNEMGYYLLRLFGEAGLRVQDIPRVTPRVVQEGKVVQGRGGGAQTVRFPKNLRQELLSYAERNGFGDDRLLISFNGKTCARSWLNWQIKQIGYAARVAEEKANPKSLRQMYQKTYNEIRSNVEVLIDQAYDQMLELERDEISWGA